MTQITSVGQIPVQERVRSAIASASARTGVGFDYLFNQARIESSFDPEAQARTSSAQGLFQFTRQTWLSVVKEHGDEHGLNWASMAISRDASGHLQVADPNLRAAILNLRNDPETASAMAAAHAADNGQILSARLGKAAETVDLYLSHFLGTGGAVRFLSEYARQPDQSAAPLFPQAAAANRTIFYSSDGQMRSLEQIRENFAAKFDVVSQKMSPLPVVRESGNSRFSLANPQTSVPPPTNGNDYNQRSLPLLTIEPMPPGISLDFARKAYQRLAEIGA